MNHDSDYFRRRAEEERVAASSRSKGDQAAISGELALAYAALARRRSAADAEVQVEAVPTEELA